MSRSALPGSAVVRVALRVRGGDRIGAAVDLLGLTGDLVGEAIQAQARGVVGRALRAVVQKCLAALQRVGGVPHRLPGAPTIRLGGHRQALYPVSVAATRALDLR